MIMKSLKFWQNWFHRNTVDSADSDPSASQAQSAARKPPAAITIRAAMRQKQKLAKIAQ